MKCMIFTSLICFSISIAHAEDDTKRIPRKPPTHAELAKKRADLAQKKVVRIATSKKPLAKHKKQSLINNSTLLADGSNWTLVPKGAVLNVPARYQDKIVIKPTGKLLEWRKFLRKNQGWLQTYPVSMKEAQGKHKMSDKAVAAYHSIGKVIVATCANGPISVAKQPAKAIQPTNQDKE